MSEEDVLRAALNFVLVPKSLAEKKELSKRFNVMRHLLEHLKVEVEDIATAIRKRGGIEKLASMAAKHRQGQNGQTKMMKVNKIGTSQRSRKKSARPMPSFGRLISVGLSPKLTEKLDQFADQTWIKMIG
ncbi:hypothetical protein [Bradyrhizobium sp. F1.13.3]|uniref:hypothetical protein n=1 Tax=Bradyrhizobium sp. F1.13.3 TaxID=3156351 RepID=UPI00339190AA